MKCSRSGRERWRTPKRRPHGAGPGIMGRSQTVGESGEDKFKSEEFLSQSIDMGKS